LDPVVTGAPEAGGRTRERGKFPDWNINGDLVFNRPLARGKTKSREESEDQSEGYLHLVRLHGQEAQLQRPAHELRPEFGNSVRGT
jgi:hypothetical protein